jgi:hypothetical protein
MPISYSIEKSFGKEGKKGFIARSRPDGILSEKQILEKLAFGTSFTKADIAGIWVLIFEIFQMELQNGRAIRTPLGKFTPTLSGSFTGPNDRYRPAKHKIRIRYTPSPGFEKSVQSKTLPLKIPPSRRMPYIESIQNVSNSTRTTYRNLDLVEVRGSHLKISDKHPETGVWIVQGNKSIPIPKECLFLTEHKKIQFQLRDIPIGSYAIRIRSLVGKAERESVSDMKLRVAGNASGKGKLR